MGSNNIKYIHCLLRYQESTSLAHSALHKEKEGKIWNTID